MPDIFCHAGFVEWIKRISACREARDWVVEHKYSAEATWYQCVRGDWLLCFAGQAGVDRRVLVRATCAIEATEGQCGGTVGIDRVRTATTPIDVASAAVNYARACADARAHVATHARHLADAYADAYADAKKAALAESAGIVRQHIDWSLVSAAMEASNAQPV